MIFDRLYMYVAVPEPRANNMPRAVVQWLGFCKDEDDANRIIHDLEAEQPDLCAFVVDDLRRWLPVVEPVEGCRVVSGTLMKPTKKKASSRFSPTSKVVEIPSAKNQDPKRSRDGSVCDLRRQNKSETKTSSSSQTVVVDPETISKQKDVREQRTQLEELLLENVPTEVVDGNQFEALLGRMATLRAFHRKLSRLETEALERCQKLQKNIQDLDDEYPAYQGAYHAHYTKSLKESGIKPENVSLLRYLECEPPVPEECSPPHPHPDEDLVA